MADQTSLSRRLGQQLLLLAIALIFWQIVCLIDSAWYYFTITAKGKALSWSDVLWANVPYWIVAALLTPAVAWVSRQARFERGRRLRSVSIHLLCVLVFALLHIIFYLMIQRALAAKPILTTEFFQHVFKYMAPRLDMEILLYLVMVVGVNAFDYYGQYLENERTATALKLEHARMEASLSSAKLEALKVQLQPHFLFNALHAISTLIMRGDSKMANEMLLHLSQFLRMTLDSTDAQEVPLAEEMEFLDAYLRIQRVRFGERLRTRMEITPEAGRAYVPNLVLQPLVENAIRHGISGEKEGGCIAVKAEVAGELLRIQVRDDGAGLPEERALQEGVGLRNIRARLAQLYPQAHTCVLRAAQGGGTVAEITLPFRLEPTHLPVRNGAVD